MHPRVLARLQRKHLLAVSCCATLCAAQAAPRSRSGPAAAQAPVAATLCAAQAAPRCTPLEQSSAPWHTAWPLSPRLDPSRDRGRRSRAQSVVVSHYIPCSKQNRHTTSSGAPAHNISVAHINLSSLTSSQIAVSFSPRARARHAHIVDLTIGHFARYTLVVSLNLSARVHGPVPSPPSLCR